MHVVQNNYSSVYNDILSAMSVTLAFLWLGYIGM